MEDAIQSYFGTSQTKAHIEAQYFYRLQGKYWCLIALSYYEESYCLYCLGSLL